MAWIATITSKIIVNGLLKVEVSYTDGTQTFNDRYETREPYSSWLKENVKRRIKDLDSVVSYADGISLGVYIPGDDIIEPPTDKEKYQTKLNKFNRLNSLVDSGILPATNTVYVNTKGYLIENYNINFID